MNASVVAIYTAERGGAEMRTHRRVQTIARTGIVDDRYAIGTGRWSFKASYVSDITFIGIETIERVAAEIGLPFSAVESRRNVVTRGITLLDLIGRRFSIGDAVFEGERPCDPCRYLEALLGKSVRAGLAVDGGGLRAHVISGGEISVGAPIVL